MMWCYWWMEELAILGKNSSEWGYFVSCSEPVVLPVARAVEIVERHNNSDGGDAL